MVVVLVIAGMVVAAAILIPLLTRWLETTRADSTLASAMSAGFAPFESLLNPNRQDQLENLEHESQLYATTEDGAPPRVQVDLDSGVVIVNDQPQPDGLPYTGSTTERQGPETQ